MRKDNIRRSILIVVIFSFLWCFSVLTLGEEKTKKVLVVYFSNSERVNENGIDTVASASVQYLNRKELVVLKKQGS